MTESKGKSRVIYKNDLENDMKVVILAGGKGTRLAEETVLRPKPMVEIGGKPLLWHIMQIYSRHGLNDFVICCGYKGYVIKEYFANYALHMSDVSIDLSKNKVELHNNKTEPWNISLIDTGIESQTGGRLKRVADHLEDQTFCFTYGDGVSDLNISELVRFHKQEGKLATLTAVRPSGRFGRLGLNDNQVVSFREKPLGGEGWINGGFFVLNSKVFDLIDSDETVWEREPMESLAQDGELAAYRHAGFWEAMDTVRDREHLERLWQQGNAEWLK